AIVFPSGEKARDKRMRSPPPSEAGRNKSPWSSTCVGGRLSCCLSGSAACPEQARACPSASASRAKPRDRVLISPPECAEGTRPSLSGAGGRTIELSCGGRHQGP